MFLDSRNRHRKLYSSTDLFFVDFHVVFYDFGVSLGSPWAFLLSIWGLNVGKFWVWGAEMVPRPSKEAISGRVGVDLGSIWVRFGVDLGSIWGRSGVDLGSFWDHFGVILGSLWGHFGITFNTF